MSKQYQIDRYILDQLHTLERRYAFRGERVKIFHFLEQYSFLVPTLIEAYDNIRAYFPHSPAFLEIASDPEEYGTDQLLISIATNLNPDQAADALNDFDKKWWLSALQRTQGKLCITLEFR